MCHIEVLELRRQNLCTMCRFGEDVQQKMVQFVAAVTKAQGLNPATAAVLDVGTGNGILLAELAQLGFANLTGSDYSQASISLAAAVMQRRGLSHVKLVVSGLLHWLPAPWLCRPLSVLHCGCRSTASQTARCSRTGRLCWGPRSIVSMLKRPGSSLFDPAALISSQTRAPLMPSASHSMQKPTGASCPCHSCDKTASHRPSSLPVLQATVSAGSGKAAEARRPPCDHLLQQHPG